MIRSIDLVEMFSEIAAAMSENRTYLCQIDARDGDADHGMTMALVFSALEETFSARDPEEMLPGELFDLAAEAFLNVDSRLAPLYASGFRRAGSALIRKRTLNEEDFGKVLTAIAEAFHEKGLPGSVEHNAADVWHIAATTYRQMQRQNLPLPQLLERTLAAAYGHATIAEAGRREGITHWADFSGFDAGGASALLILRAMRDNFSEDPAASDT